MLIKCPECELQVSDKALSCPHCGYPLKPEALKPRKPRQNKRKRLPNGFGQITELKGRALRKPFRAMVTVGKTPEGRPICKLLKPEAYFETYNDAYAALLEYNKSPFDLMQDITMDELYERWSAEFYPKRKSIHSYKAAWKYCSSIHKMKVSEVRTAHIRFCMENGTIESRGEIHTATDSMKRYIKMLLSLMFKYAISYEITDKDPAKAIQLDISQEPTNGHICFTKEEMSKITSAVGKIEFADIIYAHCYSGWRPRELCELRIEDVDLEHMTFKGGMKTKSGTGRTVPIHPNIHNIIANYYHRSVELGSPYLFSIPNLKGHKDLKMGYHRYTVRFNDVLTELKIGPHTPHDCRVQFVTMAKEYGVDEYAIKYMVGHTITDLTERVYTKRTTDWLQSEISKIK